MGRLTTSNPTGATAGKPVPMLGYAFTQEGFDGWNGYAGREAEAMLDEIVASGASWISVTPFGFCREGSAEIRDVFEGGVGSENDASVVHAIDAAHARGLRVLLKPHLWMRNRWIGEFGLTGPALQRKFWERYRRFVLHYAEMASLRGAEAFCAGVEMVHWTVGREPAWRALVSDVRALYPGPVTYAANWGYEVEHAEFWDAFDWIGVNDYMPLAEVAAAKADVLREGVRRCTYALGAVAGRWNKPVLLTEIGFPASAAAGRAPHDEKAPAKPSPADLRAQADCFRAALPEILAQPWCAGAFVWKWPSCRDHHGAHTPRGRPAADVLRKIFLGHKP